MHASGILSDQYHLYLICDGETCAKHGLTTADFVTGATKGGCRTIQYRHKGISAREYETNLLPLIDICRSAGTSLVVNDHAGLAEKYALPLHLGQEDALPSGLTVPYGRSTHGFAELALALKAKPAPAYIALGTMFPSPTKPDVATNRHVVGEYLTRTSLPLVLIGGITLDNVHELPKHERVYFAVIGDAFRFGARKEGIEKFVRLFAHELIHGQKG
ncbi:thiamine phosphate synthase [Turneriella parva]|uniref:Thiamine-phosphate diphosphorylase n=1 Tax=Turneriella parva (strain ATCC BAA-1111 / DSM 21527 / NCTC 11395 / H) TaxID=869212 RepID=I4B7M5_TURPD|nr:thiamine phosphate synthase [Turneriella parva]AFM13282.1 thiamine-phosphate diphosphorylase [Turneriella parva DSM 21527]